MIDTRFTRSALAATIAIGLCGAAGPSAPAALRGLLPGLWQLKSLAEPAAPVRSLCVTDPAIFLQLGHPRMQCAFSILADDPHGATVNYVCTGAGRGRTVIGVETPRLFHLQTQGIANGAPFDLDYEARRTGDCPAGGVAMR
jgi:hypothetical protein